MSSKDIIMLDDQSDALALAVPSQSSIMAPPTTFASLSTEMVDMISKNFDSPEDFLNFRLSSRKAWVESFDTFVETFFVHKRILWTEHALNAFAEMTTHEELFGTLFRKLKHLTFCAPPFLQKFDEDKARHSIQGWAFPKALEYNQFCDRHLSFTKKRWKLGLNSLRTFFRSLGEMQQRIGLSFEGLRCGRIYEWSPQDRPAWGVTHFMQYHTWVETIIKREPSTSEAKSLTFTKQENMLGMALEAISSACLNIVSLNLDKLWGHGDHDWHNILLDERFFAKLSTRLPMLEICFQSLHTLRLKIDLTWQYKDSQNSRVLCGLARFWSACPKLSIFRYEGVYDMDNGISFLEKVLPLMHNGRLEDLEAENSICDAEILCTLLKRHRSTLKRVRLQELDLGKQGPWEPVFDGLAKLPRLEHLSVGNISCNDENDDDCLIKFPSLPWLQRIATGFDRIERHMNALDGRDSTGSEHADIAEYGRIDAMDTSDDHLEMKDEELQPTDSIVLDGDQITKLLPALRKHLIHQKPGE